MPLHARPEVTPIADPMKNQPETTPPTLGKIEFGNAGYHEIKAPEPIIQTTVFPPIRKFETGATRDGEDGKYDYEGALSPLVIERFGEYMYSHSFQADGSRRTSDNWQKGIPLTSYMKSMFRHLFDVWKLHRGHAVIDRKTNKVVTMEDALCAVFFNVQGYLHEILSRKA